jgi:3-deoxy-manno-octulosonate cytidylyltransferase (CMP-KDO synthetase)
MKRVIVIPARYASTRLPGKPLAEIAGKPLIQWVYERASTSTLKDEVLIATDDARIEDTALCFGASVVVTSRDCPSGTDRVYEAVKGSDADIIVNVQGDEPLIRGDMIDCLFTAFEKEPLDMATLCSPITNEIELESPNTVKVVLDQKGFALYFSRSPIPFPQKPATAATYKHPGGYRHIGVYGFSRVFLERFVSLPKGRLEETESLEQLRALEAGYKIRVLVVEYDGISVDAPQDLERARLMLTGG